MILIETIQAPEYPTKVRVSNDGKRGFISAAVI